MHVNLGDGVDRRRWFVPMGAVVIRLNLRGEPEKIRIAEIPAQLAELV